MSSATAIVSKKVETGMAELTARTQSIIVRDQATFTEARLIQKDWDTYIKNVGFELDEGIQKAKDSYDHLRQQKAKWVDPAKALKEEVRVKADNWAAEEKRQAELERQREQARIDAEARRVAEENRREAERVAAEQRKIIEAQAAELRKMREAEIEAQRKAGEIGKREAEKQKKAEAEAAAKAKEQARIDEAAAKQLAAKQAEEAAKNTTQVQVAAAIPTVKGVKNQTYYYSEVTDARAIIRELLATTDPERRAFLQRFVIVDEQEIGKFARSTMDNAKATAQLPGVRFYSKG